MTTRHALVPAYLTLCLLLGGASAAGYIPNLLLQLLALPIIAWALWTVSLDRREAGDRGLLALLAAFVAVLLLQLTPLPPALWTMLPGRTAVAEGYRLLGLPLPWLPLSLAPDDALASIVWLLPAIAILLAIVILGAFRGRWIASSIILVTGLSVALGALQVVGGRDGGAYLYRITNYGQAVGFFANSNHAATLLLIAIPFLAALQASLVGSNRSPRNVSAVRLLTTAMFLVIAVGLMTNLSLAGLGLSVPVTLVTFLAFGARGIAVRRWMFAAAAALSLAGVAVVAIGPGNNLFGEQQANAELSRQTSFALTLRAAGAYLPFGSGVGTFQPVYRMHESLGSVGRTYMNHAHSDWLEVLLETGLVGVLLATAFLLWWAARVRAIWSADEPDHYARAAAIASGTIMLHSIVDYPLRTAAIAAAFGCCIGLMAGARPFARRSERRSAARHLSF